MSSVFPIICVRCGVVRRFTIPTETVANRSEVIPTFVKTVGEKKTDHENEMYYTNLHLSPHLLRSPQLIHSPFMMCFGPLTIITPKNNQIASFNPPPPSRRMPPMSCGINNKINKNSSSPHELLRSPPPSSLLKQTHCFL